MPEVRPVANLRSILALEETEKLLQLDMDQLEFFRATTGIQDESVLRAHIVAIQREAYTVQPYPSIVNFNFVQLELSHTHGYPGLIELGRARENPILLDVGCCFGVDLRKAILDGYPRESVIATDIVPEFWDIGQKLFNSTPNTFPVPFLSGDIFDPAFLKPDAPIYTPLPSSPSSLSSVKTLTELRGHVSAITISHVFHVFSTEAEQLQLARALASLLSPQPGSMIIGLQSGLSEKGVRKGFSLDMFSHSPESWTALWDGQVFEKGTVRVDVRLVERARRYIHNGEVANTPRSYLEWTVTRL